MEDLNDNNVNSEKEEFEAGIELDNLLKNELHYYFLNRKLKSLDDILIAVSADDNFSEENKKSLEIFYFTERFLLEFSFRELEKEFPDDLFNRFPAHVYEKYKYESKIYMERQFRRGENNYRKIDELLEKDSAKIKKIVSNVLFNKSMSEALGLDKLNNEKLDVIHYKAYRENGSYYFKIDGLSEVIALNAQKSVYIFLKQFKDNLTFVQRDVLVDILGGENKLTGVKKRVSDLLRMYSFVIESSKKNNKTSYKIRKQ